MTSFGGNQTAPTGAVQSSQTLATTETVTLTLTPERCRRRKVVRWASDVVDNEFMCKKSSKKCCIFHKRQVFGQWDDSDTDEEDCNCNSQETSTSK